MKHKLKTWPEHFDAVVSGQKTFEIRKNDRNFKEGDILILEKYDPEEKEYLFEAIFVKVKHILHGGQFGIEKNYCIMSIELA